MQFYGLTKAEVAFLARILNLLLKFPQTYTDQERQMARELKYYLENGHRRGE